MTKFPLKTSRLKIWHASLGTALSKISGSDVHLYPASLAEKWESQGKTVLNWEITTPWYYVNSSRNVDSEKNPSPRWDLNPRYPVISRILFHWATRDSAVTKGQIVGIDWNRISRLHSHVLRAHMNSLTASRCQIPSGTRIFSESTFLLEFT